MVKLSHRENRGVSVAILVLSSFYALGCGGPSIKAVGREVYEAMSQKSYIIGPEDRLQIEVWQNDPLSRNAAVRPDGFITLPLLNEIKAAGLTPNQLRAKLSQGYSRYLKDPVITITVLEVRSYKVYVLGKVERPGMFQPQNPVTVLQALALARGLTRFASPNQMVVIRKNEQDELRLPFIYEGVVDGTLFYQNIFLKSGDTVVVP